MSWEPILTVFTGVVAVALLMQSIAFFGMYRRIRELSSRIDGWSADVLRSVHTVSAKVDSTLDALGPLAQKLSALGENLTATSEIVRKRVLEVDAFLSETTDSARLQMARIQDVVETASRKTEATFELIHTGLMTPVNEASAVMRGLKVGVDVLLRRRKTPSDPSSQDEEMFI
jgi:hypothetical protein